MIKILATPMDIPPIKLEHRKTPALPVKTESFVLKKIRKVMQSQIVLKKSEKINQRNNPHNKGVIMAYGTKNGSGKGKGTSGGGGRNKNTGGCSQGGPGGGKGGGRGKGTGRKK